MTEVGWLACADPTPMLEHLETIDALTDRKQRLLDCACVRRLWHLLTDDARLAVEMAEDFADDLVDIEDLREIQGIVLASRDAQVNRNVLALNRGGSLPDPPELTDSVTALSAAAGAAWEFRRGADPLWHAAHALMATAPTGCHRARLAAEQAHQAGLVREVFGNPFRPVGVSSEWLTDTVLALAAQMYDAREFGAMPILADALQDADCDNDDILNHCRDTQLVHVRGCWVVDLILGKD